MPLSGAAPGEEEPPEERAPEEDMPEEALLEAGPPELSSGLTSGFKEMRYNESFRIQTEGATGEFDTIAKSYFRTNPCSLIQRLKARKCEWCETENVDLEVHHVRRLKDLKGKALWERAMIGRRRKTMVLCTACHDLLHAGKLY